MDNDGDIHSRPAAMSRGEVQQAEEVEEVEEEEEMETDDDDEALL